MNGMLLFLLGLGIGGLVGVAIMCMFQINRLADSKLIDNTNDS